MARIKKHAATKYIGSGRARWLKIDWRQSEYGCRVRDQYGNVEHCCFMFEEI